ncbi:MAG: tryptophan-rich sensory protein [Clostridia bacterium]|nr:tryptophan-rich sensory protein [Clostridia bacterium]
MKEKIKSYAFFILSALAVGGLSAFFTRNNMDINNDLLIPPLSPPPILFPIVWSILFILMGISAAMIYNSDAPKSQKNTALNIYALSLAVNFSWNIIFFNLRAFGFAFFWLLLLLFLIILTIIKYFKIQKIAAYLQIPYALWVTFAGYLTAGIWWLNR